MDLFRYIKAVVLGVFTVSQGVAASATWKQDWQEEKNNRNNYEDYSMSENCELLFHLESESELSRSDEVVGKIVYDIISQISDNPIAYCDELQMANVIENDPDTYLR